MFNLIKMYIAFCCETWLVSHLPLSHSETFDDWDEKPLALEADHRQNDPAASDANFNSPPDEALNAPCEENGALVPRSSGRNGCVPPTTPPPVSNSPSETKCNFFFFLLWDFNFFVYLFRV